MNDHHNFYTYTCTFFVHVHTSIILQRLTIKEYMNQSVFIVSLH